MSIRRRERISQLNIKKNYLLQWKIANLTPRSMIHPTNKLRRLKFREFRFFLRENRNLLKISREGSSLCLANFHKTLWKKMILTLPKFLTKFQTLRLQSQSPSVNQITTVVLQCKVVLGLLPIFYRWRTFHLLIQAWWDLRRTHPWISQLFPTSP